MKCKQKKTKKFSVTHFEIDLKIYPIDLVVVVSDDAFLLRQHKDSIRLFGEDARRFAGSCAWNNEKLIVAIFIQDQLSDVVSHECYHATDHILDMVGIKHSPETSEVYAYLFSFIFDEVTRLLNSQVAQKKASGR